MQQQPAERQKILQWAKIENGLPEIDLAVLICLSNGQITKGFLNKSGRWSGLFATGIQTPKNWPITHWMHLPPAPTEEIEAPAASLVLSQGDAVKPLTVLLAEANHEIAILKEMIAELKASPVIGDKPEEFEIWANEYSNKIMADTPRAFRQHLGAEIHSALIAAYRHLTEKTPPPVIETGEQNGEIPAELMSRANRAADEYINDLKIEMPAYADSARDCFVDGFISASHPSPAPIVGEIEEKPFGISQADIQIILDKSLKPEEIAGEASIQLGRVKELVLWFVRYAKGSANPKWFQAHAFELAYYIATNAGNRFIDLEAISRKGWKEGINISDKERELLIKHGFIGKDKDPSSTERTSSVEKGDIPEEIAYWVRVEAGSQWEKKGGYSANERNAFVEGCNSMYFKLKDQLGELALKWFNEQEKADNFEFKLEQALNKLKAADDKIKELQEWHDSHQ